MKLPYFIVDAFTTDKPFSGNPAGVCPLPAPLETSVMQAIAAENNLSETAFFYQTDEGRYRLQWFTPTAEVDLCGHATLASAFCIFQFLNPNLKEVRFDTRSGELRVSKEGDLLVMRFPARAPEECECPALLEEGLGGVRPLFVGKSRDYLVALASEEEVLNVQPDFAQLGKLDALGIIVTAPGKEVDFVSRAFFPSVGIPEDPVTGSAHCTLAPFWASRLGKTDLRARQISARGGDIRCRLEGDAVVLSGKARLYLRGEITL